MMTKEQFEAWCRKNNISVETKALIQRIREADPVRKVRSFNGMFQELILVPKWD
ncbi:hypothetical protein HQN89_26830 [Paenibacillus frigoriresistens]|uniref:hypothetical protein n=1 Tax=Paenibacillus alginolyticus TaxID=59839 RepID=UPI0015665D47|nr:hypothetical protein [Paenibacillus frigoriresistens]NRF94527.1 hypothetical protein [Paenibacillus frigoriresistens]